MKGNSSVGAVAGLALVGLLAAGLVVMVRSPFQVVIEPRSPAVAWVREHAADPKAEVIKLGTVAVVGDRRFQLVRVRALNGFGGPVIETFVMELKADGSLAMMFKPDEFAKMIVRSHTTADVAKIAKALDDGMQ